jgi:hypothetical protein
VGPLVRLVDEPGGPGRGLAAEALGRLGPEARAAVPALAAAASDPLPEVRWRAIWALGRIGPAAGAAVPVLRAALSDPEVCWRAAEALGGIGPGAVAAVPDLVGCACRRCEASDTWRRRPAPRVADSRRPGTTRTRAFEPRPSGC